jgi:predicted nucleotidyltransferase
MKKQKVLKEIVKKIVNKYKPEKIILFGSFAWGKPNVDSDVDLFIIKRTKKDFFQRSFIIRKIIDGALPVDILVRTPEELEKRLNLGDFFYQDIIKKGKYLYEKEEK